MGRITKEEDEKYIAMMEKQQQENDIKTIISNWDLVRTNMQFKK